MKIGITERGDAGIDLSWYEKLSLVDGTILITKNITSGLKYKLMQAYLSGKKSSCIVHAQDGGIQHLNQMFRHTMSNSIN